MGKCRTRIDIQRTAPEKTWKIMISRIVRNATLASEILEDFRSCAFATTEWDTRMKSNYSIRIKRTLHPVVANARHFGILP